MTHNHLKIQEEMRASKFSKEDAKGSIRRPHSGDNSCFEATLGNHHGTPHSRENSNWRYRGLEFPLFIGDNPDGWITRVECYFAYYRLLEEEKSEAIFVGLYGDALLWFQWDNQRQLMASWSELKCMMLRHFRWRKLKMGRWRIIGRDSFNMLPA